MVHKKQFEHICPWEFRPRDVQPSSPLAPSCTLYFQYFNISPYLSYIPFTCLHKTLHGIEWVGANIPRLLICFPSWPLSFLRMQRIFNTSAHYVFLGGKSHGVVFKSKCIFPSGDFLRDWYFHIFLHIFHSFPFLLVICFWSFLNVIVMDYFLNGSRFLRELDGSGRWLNVFTCFDSQRIKCKNNKEHLYWT